MVAKPNWRDIVGIASSPSQGVQYRMWFDSHPPVNLFSRRFSTSRNSLMIVASIIGDAAGVVGVGLSLWALAQSWNARRFARRVLERNRQMLGTLDIQRALEIAREIQADAQHMLADGERLSLTRCDELRELIRVIHGEIELTHQESEKMRLAIGALTAVPLHNTPHMQMWIRRLMDDLDGIRRRLARELTEV